MNRLTRNAGDAKVWVRSTRSWCECQVSRHIAPDKVEVRFGRKGASLRKTLSIKSTSLLYKFAKRASQIDDSEPRILIVSDNLQFYECLIKGAKDCVVAVPVKFDTWSLDDLQKAILIRAGKPTKQYASVGLLDHGGPGSFCLLKVLGSEGVNAHKLADNKYLREFFVFLARYVSPPRSLHAREDLNSRIDLLGCCVAAEFGKALIESLEDLTQVNWAATVTKTGNIADGFDWEMQTECGLGPVDQCYSYLEPLTRWHESWLSIDVIFNCCHNSTPISPTEFLLRQYRDTSSSFIFVSFSLESKD